jgi:flagellar biosynthesis protein FlhF
MHVKRLYRPTVREALAAARQELGPGALVLSTELVPAPGWRGWMGQRTVRLTAAAERPEEGLSEASEVSTDRPDVTAHRHLPNAAQAGLIARLQAAGLSATLAESVVRRMTPSECRGGSEAVLVRALATELESTRGDDDAYARYEVFVGPPGVGKTTTIAKIAAQERAGSGRPVGLVAADAFRAGAIEQLRCYATVLGAPFRVARSASELDEALDSTRHTAFVDTAGRSPSDPSLTSLFDVFLNRRNVRTHLVMAADTSLASARRILERYAAVKPSRVVITKLDEAESVLPLFNLLREQGLPISYLAAGQRVPEDLQRATPACLAAALLQEPSAGMAACH